MAIKKDNDNLMGVDTTTYNRVQNTGALANGSKNIALVCQKFSSKEYRIENPNDFKPFTEQVELTDSEKDQVWAILYTALNRKLDGVEA